MHETTSTSCFNIGSLEEVVENLVKTWEMEASHKKDMSQWTTIDHGNYCVQTNGGEVLDGVKAFEIGNYNALLKGCPAYEKCKSLRNHMHVKICVKNLTFISVR